MAEQIASRALPVNQWVSARTLAARIGAPWRVVACALGRLAAQGCIESQREEWKSARSRVKVRMLYRKMAKPQPMPAWLQPPVAKPAIVARRITWWGDE